MTSPGTGGEDRYVTFSATRRSPMSKEGYMDREGMKRGSAMKDRMRREMASAPP